MTPSLLAPEDIFKPIKDGGFLEDLALATLDKWFSTYLQEMAVQRGFERRRMPPPKQYNSVYSLEGINVENLPAVFLVSPGLIREPRKRGDGSYEADWALAVAIVVSGSEYNATRTLARVYAAAARAIMLQQRSLGGYVSEMVWLDESYDDLPTGEGDHTLGVAQVFFQATVEDVVNIQGGPRTGDEPDPDTQPGSEWPVATNVKANIHRPPSWPADVPFPPPHTLDDLYPQDNQL